MTEAEWQAGADPQRMLEYVWRTASDRKGRLYACTCCRHLWKLLGRASRQAVEVAERFAEGLTSAAERAEAIEAAQQALEHMVAEQRWDEAGAARDARNALRDPVTPFKSWRYNFYRLADNRQHINLVRELFGNPFQPIRVSASWLAPAVRALAQDIYEDRAFNHLPILADALEDAGCDNAAILSHCRQPGEHVRGCWVVDLILGKT